MRILGIDYGEKRVGTALSNEEETVAFPQVVLENSSELIQEIVSIIEEKKVGLVVLGESLDSSGVENALMSEIRGFGGKLTQKGIKVLYESELFSSVEASRYQGEGEFTDASAAAIILQRFLDKKLNKK